MVGEAVPVEDVAVKSVFAIDGLEVGDDVGDSLFVVGILLGRHQFHFVNRW